MLLYAGICQRLYTNLHHHYYDKLAMSCAACPAVVLKLVASQQDQSELYTSLI